MTAVYWLEQTEADVPVDNDWLGPDELVRLSGLRFAKRRADWRLGRWTAKRALAAHLKIPDDRQGLARIEIRPAASGAPDAFIDNSPSTTAISLSHSSGRALCAVAPGSIALGCDLERIEPRPDVFVADYFAAEEQALLAQSSAAQSAAAQSSADNRSCLVALIWSAKESALKALRTGLRLDTRSVIVTLSDFNSSLRGWQPLRVNCSDGQVFSGWWQCDDQFVQTLVSDLPSDPPTPLLG